MSNFSLKALIVDDDPDILFILERILESFGHTVASAFSGPDALAALGNREDKFDVLFTDLSIPRMNGWDIVFNARQLIPTLPLILMTGWPGETVPVFVKNQGHF